jgi:2-polyprenyl-6-methoxyphenol hydroxylase-like FAD-dependent oxidoreductase
VWPDVAEENERISEDPWISYHKVTGEIVTGPDPVMMPGTSTASDGVEQRPTRIYRHNRPKFMQMLVSKLLSIGVDISFGNHVVDYYEDPEKQTAGVVLDDGRNIEADVVIAADGLGTKSHKLVNGHDIRAHSTGYSVYRTAFPAELLAADPVVDKRFQMLENGHPLVEMWAG